MELNIDTMLSKQAKLLQTINNTSPERENTSSVMHTDMRGTEYEVSPTNMLVVKVEGIDTLTLTRVIASYVYRVEFSCDTKCCDIVQWFEVTNKVFMQCSKRKRLN